MTRLLVLVMVLLGSVAQAQAPKESPALQEARATLRAVEQRLLATEDGKLYLSLQRIVSALEAEQKAKDAPKATGNK